MEECLGECCAQICVRLILQGILTGVICIVDKQIVQRRELVIRRGRQVQRILHIPKCLNAFTEEDPGMLDCDIRLAGTGLSISYFFVGLAVFFVVKLRVSFWHPWVLAFGIVNPLCVSTLVWFSLIMSRRRRLRYMTEKGGWETMDTSLEEALRSLWSTT